MKRRKLLHKKLRLIHTKGVDVEEECNFRA